MPSGNEVSWLGTMYGLTGPIAMDMGASPPWPANTLAI